MSKVAVVYWSGTGNTEMMANAVVEGAKNANLEAELFTSAQFSTDILSGFDKVALGCPSMGAEELEDSEFRPMFDSIVSSLANKDVVLFGSYDWGDGQWMRDWEEEVKGANANLVSEGLIVNLTPEDNDLEACRQLGASLA